MGDYISFDVGGSFIKYGVLKENGQILFQDKAPTNSHLGAQALLEQLYAIADELAPRWNASYISIATTGIVDIVSGTMQSGISGWINGYEGLELKAAMERHSGLVTEVENDVNCVALAESWLGSAKGYRNIVCMTIGTGIGGALLIDGNLFHGNSNMAMEIGRMPIYPSTLEDLASVRAAVYEYAKLCNIPTTEVDGLLLAQREREGDPIAIRVFDNMCHYLAQGIASIVSTLTPDVLVLGGAIAADRDLIDGRLKKHLKAILDLALFETINLQYAKLENTAGLVGSIRHHQIMTRWRKLEEMNNDKAI